MVWDIRTLRYTASMLNIICGPGVALALEGSKVAVCEDERRVMGTSLV